MKKPWYESYDSNVKHSLVYPDISIPTLLKISVDRNSQRTAIIQGTRQIAYSQLYQKSSNLARKFIADGLKPGDRVAICLGNQIEFALAFYATLIAGGVVAAVNPTYPAREIKFQADIAKPKFFIGNRKNLALVNEIKSQIEFGKVYLCDESEDFSILELEEEATRIMQTPNLEEIDSPEIKSDQVAILQFSGGTTGSPKAAVGLHRNVISNIFQFSEWLSPVIKENEFFLTAIPLFHVYGMVIGLNVALNLGATIILADGAKEIEGLAELISKHKVSVFPGVPSIFNSFNRYFKTKGNSPQLVSLKVCISGSAPLPMTVKSNFEELTGSHLVEGYGLSEAPTATHCNPVGKGNRDGSIGLPLPDVDCGILDLQTGKISITPGITGELLVRGPQVMQGYFGNQKETVETLAGGWLHTGDIAYMDKDGYFYIVGRRKEMIKVGGLQVWPNEIEDVLRSMPGIKEVAVTGIADENSGEVSKAWVVLEDGASLNLTKVREFCENKLAGYKIPRKLSILDELPKSAVGKILKYQLVDK